MNIKELIQEQYPNSKHADSIKSAKLLDDRFIYTELNSGASVFYEIREGRLYIYKRYQLMSAVANREDNERWLQIFRAAKINELLNEE